MEGLGYVRPDLIGKPFCCQGNPAMAAIRRVGGLDEAT